MHISSAQTEICFRVMRIKFVVRFIFNSFHLGSLFDVVRGDQEDVELAIMDDVLEDAVRSAASEDHPSTLFRNFYASGFYV